LATGILEVGVDIMNKFKQYLHLLNGVFLNVKNKIYLWFLNKFIAKEDEYYGFVEPQTEWMISHNKKFWIQPYHEEVLK
jgi:type I restriction-modification system DNA methylase subunit